MNEDVIADLKQLIASTVRQEVTAVVQNAVSGLREEVTVIIKNEVAVLREDMNQRFDDQDKRFNQRFDDLDAKVTTIADAHAETLDEYGERLTSLERQAA